MKINLLLLVVLTFTFFGCQKEDLGNSDEKYVPTDVLVKVKGTYTIEKVFEFINSFEHEVENIHSQKYTSSLPPDSLQYVLDYLNARPYTSDGKSWFVNGYLHYQTNVITVFPRFFDIKNTGYQEDWLETMETLQLTDETESETAGAIIFFHVPAGKEKEWVKKFEEYQFVEWAELNYILEINPYP